MGGPRSLPNLNMFGRTRINVETPAMPANRSLGRTDASPAADDRHRDGRQEATEPECGSVEDGEQQNAAPSHIWLLSDEVWSSRNRRYWKNVAAATPHRIASLKTHAGPANINIGVPSATTTFQVAGSQKPVSREPGSGHNS